MRALRLDHVSVTCAELERSLAFYRDLLGLRVIEQGESAEPELATITGLAGARIRFADLDTGAGQVLELIEYADPPGAPLRARTCDPGATHLAFRVEDVVKAHRALTDAGVTTRSRPVEVTEGISWAGSRCFYALDPDGVTVEFIER